MAMDKHIASLGRNLKGDIFGGITTGIVALPLALALGVASGAGAAAGLYSAIFTGTIAAIFGGTPAQVSGPTAGMTAVLIGVYQVQGAKGLFAAMFLGGAFQLLFAALRLGKYIHYIPQPVVAGFTNGIAILIFWKQFKDIFLPGGPMYSPAQMAVAAGVVALIIIWPRITRAIPGSLVALLGGTALVLLWHLPAQLLGPMPSGLPAPHFPLAGMDLASIPALIKAGLIVALLGTIESLLSAVVVDEMTGTRHRSDREIFGQGIANLIAPVFGGLAGTGAIVRSAVNVRAGGRTLLAALVHSALILGIMLGLGRYAALIPVPVLWGILIATAFGMVDWESIRDLVRAPKSDSAVMIVTTVLTVVEDLTIGVLAGLLLSFVLFTVRMSRATVDREHRQGTVVLRLEGPLFFGVAKRFLETVESAPPGVPQVWDMSRVSTIDATGAAILRKARREAERHGKTVTLTGLQQQPREVLERLEVLSEWRDQTVSPSYPEALAILLAVDGSVHSGRAATVALDLARQVPGADVAIVHVLGAVDPNGHYNPLHYKELLTHQHEEGEQLVASVRSQFTAHGITSQGLVVRGSPAQAVVQHARDWGADMIIMGSRGLSDWQGLLLGSTSREVMQLSACPVLVVK